MAKDDIVEYQFEKGVSGNPKGRPPGIPNAKTRYQRMLGLLEEVKNPVTGEMEKLPLIEVMDLQLFKKARNGDIKAYQEIMNRLEGKAAQSRNTAGSRSTGSRKGTPKIADLECILYRLLSATR